MRVVARSRGPLHDLHQAPIGILPVPRRDPLGDDGALGVLTDMHHLGAGIRLLIVIGEGNGIEFAYGIVALQLGYFQVIAEPVSTWVQEIFERLPRHLPRFVTKL